MQGTSHFLKAAYQVGPWRITRKVLLFVIVFCVVIVGFGTIILKTHMFNEDWEDIDWDDDEDWEDSISGGDSVLLAIIGLAGLGALISCVGCFMASFNSPEQLNDTGSIFTLSGVTPTNPTTASAPQAVTRQQQQQQHQPHHQRRPRRDAGEVKSYPPTSDYPQGPSYPVNPGYPPHPPPYSEQEHLAGTAPPGGAPPPPPHTISDLPPPYTPGHYQQNSKY